MTTDSSVLSAGTGGTTAYNDLQSGIGYGTFTVLSSDVGAILEVQLDPGAVPDIQAALGTTFAVGFHIDSLRLDPGDTEALRFSASTESRTHQLVLTIAP